MSTSMHPVSTNPAIRIVPLDARLYESHVRHLLRAPYTAMTFREYVKKFPGMYALMRDDELLKGGTKHELERWIKDYGVARNPDDSCPTPPSTIVESFEHNLDLVSSPEFQDATPEAQAVMLTAEEVGVGDGALANPSGLHDKLVHAVTQYDMQQERKPGYNRYALPQYLGALQNVEAEMQAGKSARSALVSNFNGRLLDRLLKVAGEATSTREEQRYNPAAFDRCVKSVRASGTAANEYAVCTAQGLRNPHPHSAIYGIAYDFGFAEGEAVKHRAGTTQRFKHLAYRKWLHSTAAHTDKELWRALEDEWSRGYGDGAGIEPHRSNPGILDAIRAGDRVTILIYAGRGRDGPEYKPKTGRAVMRGPHGWVLNMGGPHGTPGIATEENIVKVHKRNPEESAAELSEVFHGRPATEVTEVVETLHEHEYLADLVDIMELHIETESGYGADLVFPKSSRPRLASSEDGRSFYIVGGDQSVDLAAIHMSGPRWEKDLMVLGRLKEIVYFSAKEQDQFKGSEYFHKSREGLSADGTKHRVVSTTDMVVLYSPRDELLSLAGGQAYVDSAGIVG